MSEESEFGSGIVVCLAKFSEHLWSEMAMTAIRCNHWLKDRSQGGDLRSYFESCVEIFGSPENVLSHQIEMWMNGASDHFYDLNDKAPEKLKELASLALKIGHGFTGDTWTMDHVDQIRKLWKEACLAVDEEMLGVNADWGQW